MRDAFTPNEVRHVEFGVCHDEEGRERYTLVPVDAKVQSILAEMVSATVTAFGPPDNPWDVFEPAEKYGPTERLRAPLEHEYMKKTRDLYGSANLEVASGPIGTPRTLAFYFGVFRDAQQRKLLGIRRAAQFKGVLKAKPRLIRWIDDSLRVVEDDMFRLDHDFDYLVCGDSAWILRPSGFEFTAGIEEAIAGGTRSMTLALEKSLPFVPFGELADFVVSHRRAGRLVAALYARDDLARTAPRKLMALCKENGVAFTSSGGKVFPQPGSELAFLETLDRRRYSIELVNREPERYLAPSRRRTT